MSDPLATVAVESDVPSEYLLRSIVGGYSIRRFGKVVARYSEIAREVEFVGGFALYNFEGVAGANTVEEVMAAVLHRAAYVDSGDFEVVA